MHDVAAVSLSMGLMHPYVPHILTPLIPPHSVNASP